MKCAKCSHDIPDGAPECPWCAAFGPDRTPAPDRDRARCPVCGSTDVEAVRHDYSPGCGCLGLLLFGWIGLLLGLLGAGQVDLVCRNCGTVRATRRPGCGCLPVLLLFLAAVITLAAAGTN
ncbi:MAG: hypothetical protein IJS01_01540 [Lentisphaeria bacterium]|nr:hypothetical protein [Lentisphaeria bacterium]